MVTQVFTLPNLLRFGLVAMVLWTTDAAAQTQSSRNTSSRSSESSARATWSPTRGGSTASNNNSTRASTRPMVSVPVEDAVAPRPSSTSQRRAATGKVKTGNVRTVGHNHGIPVPDDESLSIVDGSYHETMDGQVMLSPMHDGAVYGGGYGDGSCDSMGGCGCGEMACGGGCDSMGSCGGCGSAGCSTCGELITGRAWRPCLTLCVPQNGWFSAEYLNWYQDGMDLPPLVTTHNGNPLPNQQDAGVIGRGGQVIFGGNDVLTDSFDGFRLRGGVWLDKCHTWGIGGEYFQIGEETESFSRTSSGSTILARPFFNINPADGPARQDAELVAFPNVVAGTITSEATSQLRGAGIHLRRMFDCDQGCSSGLFCGCPGHFCTRQEVLVGYRYMDLEESLFEREILRGLDPAANFDIFDRFETRNQFNGVDLGWAYKKTRGYWTFDSLLRLAVGSTNQTVTINGGTTISGVAGQPTESFVGGLRAQRTNIDTYEQDQFTVIPELNLNLGYQLTDHFRATVGYTFIYWSNVVRPGDHIDYDINPALLPPEQVPFTGAERPGFEFDTTDYWAQGISIGGEFRW